MPRPKPPPIIDIDIKDIEQMLERARQTMTPQDYALIKAMADSLIQLTTLVRERGTTIARIRRLFHLSGSEKSSAILPKQPPLPACPNDTDSQADNACSASFAVQNDATQQSPTPPASDQPPDAQSKPPKKKRKGHGRVAASAYLKAQHIAVCHQSLQAGDRCPKCQSGNLSDLKDPAPIVRIFGNAPLAATCWDCDRLRCGACGLVFTAPAPQEAQGPKYDETAASMIELLHYGTGMPLNRLDHLQQNLQTPLPSSTQWDVINQSVEMVRPAFNELVRLGAQGQVLHNDDSYMRILQFMGKRRAELLANGKLPDPDRTGLFTTAIVAIVATIGAIALFFTGRKHAGENLADVLKQRAADLPAPIQMGDALSRNLPKGHEVQQSNCIAHGRRQVVDEIENYPVECSFVIERLALVYKLDQECKQQGLSDQERLLAHQNQSDPIMKELHDWMTAQLDEKRIEPNSGLGRAFNYFLKRWQKFTLFLRVPGAPLDNNIAERALKMTINHRKTSLFYRSQHGASVGDVFMTLIHTAQLHHENPFDYLTELQRNYKAVAERPADWLPWNYRNTLARLRSNGPLDRQGPLPGCESKLAA
jgi:transposase